jgi:cyclase
MSTLAWILAAAAAVTPPDPARPGPHEGYETVTVADGVYAFIAPEGRTGTVQGNSVAIVGSDGVLVVDTGQFPALTRRMIGDIRRLTDQPVRYVVNTHWHGDHLLGNFQYRQAFPGVVIINHVETRRLCDRFFPSFVEKSRQDFPRYVADMRAAVARGTRRSGEPLSDAEKDYFTRQADELEAATRQLPEMPYVPAQLAFERALTIHLGTRAVRVLHLGRGNTGGDTVVFVPDAGVVAVGDLVVYPTPYSFGSWLAEWPETLRKLEALGARRLVPGHGPVLTDTVYVDTLIALVEETRRQVQAAVRESLSLEETRRRVDLARFREALAGADYWRQRAFDDFYLRPAVERAYKEARGEALEEGAEE